jgi:hypothetical protein
MLYTLPRARYDGAQTLTTTRKDPPVKAEPQLTIEIVSDIV